MDYKRVLILHFTNGMSSREIAETTGDGKNTVNEFLKCFRECEELSYPLSEEVANEFIAGCLYKKAGNWVNSDLYRDFDPEEVHRALAKKGETLKHLRKKYNAAGTVNGRKPLSYRQYWQRYTNWLDSTKVTFHIQRIPGVNLELDFAGKTLCIHDRRDPEMTTKVTIFVAALSFSDYFYIEGMTCYDVSNWLRANNNAISYFGEITQTVTPDNCKVAVIENKDWINPSVNKDFQAWAECPHTRVGGQQNSRKQERQMARTMEQKKTKKGTPPPRYDEAFKAGAVRPVTEQGRQPTEVTKELGICIDTLRSWLKVMWYKKVDNPFSRI